MIERVFLGWERCFAGRAAGWLLDWESELSQCLVVVPTAQSGRRLREELAMQAGALLAPTIVTPGALLRTPDATVAADWVERLAWIETLEGIDDWSPYQEVFPQPPDIGGGRAAGLAGEMVELRRRLQENGLTLVAAARRLAQSVEAGRWEALGRLETMVEQQLAAWGMRSRSRTLASGVQLPQGISAVVLAGVTDAPPVLERALEAWGVPVVVLIAAPASEAENFSQWGRPLDCWGERNLPWPTGEAGSVVLAADVRQEAAEALRLVAAAGTMPSELVVGAADAAGGSELAQAFTRAGWTAFHPAEAAGKHGLARWFKLWGQWLTEPLLATAAELLTLPESAALVRGSRAEKAMRLARLRDDWLARWPDDLRQRIETGSFRHADQRHSALEVLQCVEILERWRQRFSSEGFPTAMERMLERLESIGEECAAEARGIRDWLAEAGRLMQQVPREAAFWLELMADALPAPAAEPPVGRMIDVHGWLELLFQPGRHLVLCGMNEGKVPANHAGDPWLGESAACLLGLSGKRQRAARDAYLYQALLEGRRADGRVDVLCAKTGAEGDPLLPSRLLLAADRDALPERVKWLFRGIEPPEAGLRWHADWQWRPRAAEIPLRLPVTSLRDWLACPFRFYLKHGLGMQEPEPARVEWNARDFGNLAHEILERWGRDEQARELAEPTAIHEWLCADLERTLASRFGGRPPLAVSIQCEALRQRFAWLADVQAATHAAGWRVVEVEHKFELRHGEWTIVAKIDRIDRHAESGALRVIDYKTGRIGKVEAEHRTQVTRGTVLPEHLGGDGQQVVHECARNGKAVSCRWTNLQLPLYAAAVRERDGIIPQPCYFALGETQSDVALSEWQEFSAADLDAAVACAEWILGQIAAGVFWPPAEKPRHDDFAELAAGRKLSELCVARK